MVSDVTDCGNFAGENILRGEDVVSIVNTILSALVFPDSPR